MPRALEVDPIASYARRDGDQVRVVLVLSTTVSLTAGAKLRLVQGDRRVTATATVEKTADGWSLSATTEASELGTGVWKMRLRSGGSGLPLKARLLIGDEQPIALLPGLSPTHPHEGAKTRGGG